MVEFKADREQVQRILKVFQSALKDKVFKKAPTELEISVTSTDLTFSWSSMSYTLPCQGNGAARANLPIVPFIEIMKLEVKDNIEVIIEDSEVTLGTFTFPAKTVLFRNDKVLREISLPKKYNLQDLLRITKSDYSKEELEFNKIPEKITSMEDGLGKAIKSCYLKLKPYGVDFKDIEQFVFLKVYHNL